MLPNKRTKSAATDSSPETPAPKRQVREDQTRIPIYRPNNLEHSVTIPIPNMSSQRETTTMCPQIGDLKVDFDENAPTWARQMYEIQKQSAILLNHIATSWEMNEAKMNKALDIANSATEKVNEVMATVQTVMQENQSLKIQIKAQEAYSKKYNLLFFNIPASPQETSGDLMNKLATVLRYLGLDLAKIYIDNIHRLPQRQGNPVIVKFVSYLDRDQVWSKRKQLKDNDSKIFIKEHLPVEIESDLKKLLPIRKAAIAQGYRVKLNNEKAMLIVNGQSYSAKTLHTLPEDLRPEKVSTRTIDDHTFFFTGACPLSNFYQTSAPFKVDGTAYSCAEQFYQCQKADFFGDKETKDLVMAAKTPYSMFMLGKKVKNFSKSDWQAVAQEKMLKVLTEKFEQCDDAKNFLMNTGNNKLIEAAPNDPWWGIGFHLHDPELMSRKKDWGKNVLGQCLGIVRQRLQNKST